MDKKNCYIWYGLSGIDYRVVVSLTYGYHTAKGIFLESLKSIGQF